MVKSAVENDDDLTIERASATRHLPLPCLRHPILETSPQPGEPRAREQLKQGPKKGPGNLKRGQNDHPTRMVVLSERSEPKDLSQMPSKPHVAPKPFTFTQFAKNASATPLDSHTFKTKDLKPFRFTHLQKEVGVR